jgi:hypothetical protein
MVASIPTVYPVAYNTVALTSGAGAASANLAAINAALAAVAGTDAAVCIPAGTWYYNGVINVVSAMLFGAPGALLIGTDGTATPQVAIHLKSVRPKLKWLTIQVQGATARGTQLTQMGVVLNQCVGHELYSVTVIGCSAAAFMHYGAAYGRTFNCTDIGSLADGFHHTFASHDLETAYCTVIGAGDDYFACVSYASDVTQVNRINVHDCTASGQALAGRGVTVVGGQNITYTNINVSGCWTRGLYVGAENGYLAISNVTYTNVNVAGTGVAGSPYTQGAEGVFVWAFSGTSPVANVTFNNCTVKNQATALVTVLAPNVSGVNTSGVSQL